MNILDNRKLTEEELDAIYIYLDMNFDSITEEEISMWKQLLEEFDKENYED